MARLIRETVENANLLPHELLQNCIFILNAGHETTTNLICSGIWLLSQRPRIIERLNAEPDLWPAAVEEILRMESPNQLGNRRALSAFDMGGKTWPEGTLITLGMGAANRDPEVFDEPDSFLLDRGDNPHLAFAGGVHVCAGNTIARIEGQIALAGLFSRWPRLKAASTKPQIVPQGWRGKAALAAGPFPRVREAAARSVDARLVAVVDSTGLCRRGR